MHGQSLLGLLGPIFHVPFLDLLPRDITGIVDPDVALRLFPDQHELPLADPSSQPCAAVATVLIQVANDLAGVLGLTPGPRGPGED